LPAWLRVGESVHVRPGYSSGCVAFVGRTEFAAGVWIGVELDAPTGEREGKKGSKLIYEVRNDLREGGKCPFSAFN